MMFSRLRLLAWAAVAMPWAGHAQMHKVAKPETVVRAVGVYEWTGELAKPASSRLVPVAVYIDGALRDAGVYLARPVPFALETGTIFDLDQAGVVKGTFELSFARHLEAVGVHGEPTPYEDGWFGYGAYKPLRVVPVKPPVKQRQSNAKLAVNGKTDSGVANSTSADPDRPTMKRKEDSASDAGAVTPDDPDRPTMKRRADSGSDTASAPDDPGRPTMKRRQEGTDTNASASAGPTPGDDPDRPTLRKRSPAEAKRAQAERADDPTIGVAALNDDPNRPTMRRGKPASGLREDDLPKLTGLPLDLHQMVAVSDAADRPPHNFVRSWESTAEQAEIRGKMQEFARQKLAAYGGFMAPTAPLAGATPAARRRAALKAKQAAPDPPAITLEDEDLKPYTLSYGGAPTFVYTASAAGAQDGAVRYVTLVAQSDALGELKLAMSSVTDSQHMDRTPWIRLVDAVDVEASNRASLLLELRAQHSRQFALYQVIGAQAQQIFITGSTQ